MSFLGKCAWEVVIQTKGLSEIQHDAGFGAQLFLRYANPPSLIWLGELGVCVSS